MAKEIPKNYKPKIDEAVLGIADIVKNLVPFVGELGDSITFNVDDYSVEIKYLKDRNVMYLIHNLGSK